MDLTQLRVRYIDFERRQRRLTETATQRKLQREKVDAIARVLESMPGYESVEVDHSTIDRIDDPSLPGTLAVIFGGGLSQLFDYRVEEQLAFLQAATARVPTLFLCASMQYFVKIDGGHAGPIGRGEGAKAFGLPEGFANQHGFRRVRAVAADPLLEGLGEHFWMWKYHFWEVKELPPHWKPLAVGETGMLEILRRDDPVPRYASQGHPEQWDDAHPDGKKVVENFLRIAIRYWQAQSP